MQSTCAGQILRNPAKGDLRRYFGAAHRTGYGHTTASEILRSAARLVQRQRRVNVLGAISLVKRSREAPFVPAEDLLAAHVAPGMAPSKADVPLFDYLDRLSQWPRREVSVAMNDAARAAE